MKKVWLIITAMMMGLPAWAGDLPVEARIEQAMMGDHRSEANVARNRYRHPWPLA